MRKARLRSGRDVAACRYFEDNDLSKGGDVKIKPKSDSDQKKSRLVRQIEKQMKKTGKSGPIDLPTEDELAARGQNIFYGRAKNSARGEHDKFKYVG